MKSEDTTKKFSRIPQVALQPTGMAANLQATLPRQVQDVVEGNALSCEPGYNKQALGRNQGKRYCQGNLQTGMEMSVTKRDVDRNSSALYVAFAIVYRSMESTDFRTAWGESGKVGIYWLEPQHNGVIFDRFNPNGFLLGLGAQGSVFVLPLVGMPECALS